MECPESLSRLSTFFRLILIIPVVFFLALLQGSSFNSGASDDVTNVTISGAAALVFAAWCTIIVRRNIPHFLFDFMVAVHRFANRAAAYIFLLTDKYPAFEGDWFLQFEVDYPERLTWWKIFFWKVITAIPHFIILFFLALAMFVVVTIAWFAILFTGQYPRGLHTFVVGVMRWGSRVTLYVESLTDEYPPFSLD
jgi:hypothetical protein